MSQVRTCARELVQRVAEGGELSIASLRELGDLMLRSELVAAQVAAELDASASIVGSVESGAAARLSTLEKHIAAPGFELELNAATHTLSDFTSRQRRLDLLGTI